MTRFSTIEEYKKAISAGELNLTNKDGIELLVFGISKEERTDFLTWLSSLIHVTTDSITRCRYLDVLGFVYKDSSYDFTMLEARLYVKSEKDKYQIIDAFRNSNAEQAERILVDFIKQEESVHLLGKSIFTLAFICTNNSAVQPLLHLYTTTRSKILKNEILTACVTIGTKRDSSLFEEPFMIDFFQKLRKKNYIYHWLTDFKKCDHLKLRDQLAADVSKITKDSRKSKMQYYLEVDEHFILTISLTKISKERVRKSKTETTLATMLTYQLNYWPVYRHSYQDYANNEPFTFDGTNISLSLERLVADDDLLISTISELESYIRAYVDYLKGNDFEHVLNCEPIQLMNKGKSRNQLKSFLTMINFNIYEGQYEHAKTTAAKAIAYLKHQKMHQTWSRYIYLKQVRDNGW